MDIDKAFKINQETWNKKTAVHYESSFYDKSAFAKAVNSSRDSKTISKDSLNSYETQALGDVKGKSLLHLQCHFGQDSLSWASRGAQVTGVDISDKAIELARKLSAEYQLPANFLCCNVLDTSKFVSETFDIIFTSYGVIGWLPDLKPWAQMIADRLKSGGVFYMVEFHPIAWMYDYIDGSPVLKYHYHQEAAIYEEYAGTYADQHADITSKEYTWNHSLSEVIQSLIDAGLQINNFAEHDGSPYNIFPDMELQPNGLFYLKEQKYPLIFEIMAQKPTVSTN
jgi:2-polyprenyl-3-methyl-5-hydroxy-6-metoxy-1,4-benzoquinol methylase